MKTIFILCSVLALVSCTTINKSQPTATLELSIKNKLVADISVDTTKKLSGVASKTKILGFIPISGPEKFADGVTYGFNEEGGIINWLLSDSRDEVKAAATWEAIRNSGADIIVAPQYLVERKNYFYLYTKITVKVTGYPGVIKKIE